MVEEILKEKTKEVIISKFFNTLLRLSILYIKDIIYL